jgi:type II secretory pathway pseudopilin PulG
MPGKFQRKQGGMSLIEVIVSMFIIFVLFLLYVAALNTTVLIKENNNEDIAYHIANKQMETLRETPYTSLVNTAGTAIPDTLLNKIPSGSGTYTIDDFSSMTGIKEFTVTVIWNDGTSRNIVLKSLSGNGGLNP